MERDLSKSAQQDEFAQAFAGLEVLGNDPPRGINFDSFVRSIFGNFSYGD